MTRRLTIVLGWGAACIALSWTPVPRAHAIMGGSVDSSRTAVAVITDGSFLCSGVLIAPTVVLTAASCLPVGVAVDSYVVSFDTSPFTDPSPVYLGVSEVHKHPSWDENTLAHDVGVLILADVAAPTPLPWYGGPAPAPTVGTLFSVSGYGQTSAVANDSGTRRTVQIDVDMVDVDGTFVHDQGDLAGPCFGDTGGPALSTVDAVETVVGISIYGDQQCNSYSRFLRTDLEAAFISQFAPEPNAFTLAAGAIAALTACARRRA